MDKLLRVYFDPDEIHPTTGYPYAWSQIGPKQPRPDLGPDAYEQSLPIKDLVREQMGHRCQRCGHPYRKGEHGNGEWSVCDDRCAHPGPVGVQMPDGEWLVNETQPYVSAALVASFGGGEPGPLSARWRILTVHHLNGVKHDCRWWNLAALCQRCHLTIQGKVHMDRPYVFQHKDWFAMHAAGFYATKYLGVALSRAETAARLDELLGLEQTHDPLF